MSTISLRQGHAADWPAVESLLRANHLPLDGAREHLPTFLIAHQGPAAVGCAGVELRGEVALLRSVAVAPDLQGRGIGRRMVAMLLAEAGRRNLRAIYLLTTTASDYFRRFGFAPVARASVPAALQDSAEFQGACPDSAALLALDLTAPAPDGLQALPVAVLGAGPVGLAAAAQLIERRIPFVILEAAQAVGANLIDYGHVRLFSPWRYDIDPAMARLLAATGWQAPPPEALPLAGEVVRQVLAPFARLPQVAAALHLETRVLAVTREGFDKVKSAGREQAPFLIRALRAGEAVEFRARAVIDATGTWSHPNPLGASGLPAIGEAENADRIHYGIPDVLGLDRERYAGRRTLVVGAGHSAANALLALAELSTQAPGTALMWAVRSPALQRVFGGGAADALPARGELGSALKALRDAGGLQFHAGLRITRVQRHGERLAVIGIGPDGREQRLEGIDQIVCATGQRPDLGLTSELRVRLDPWLESNEALGPLIDPNVHSCGTVRPHGHRELGHPEPGLYTLGVKSYGRAPTFLMATGFEQARSVVAAIAGDLAAADRVELDLPETGVCSVGSGPAIESAGGCATGGWGVPGRSTPATATPPVTAAAPLPVPAAAVSGALLAETATGRGSTALPAPAEGCCGGPATADASACCVRDEQAKAAGASGCGCGSSATTPAAIATASAPSPAARAAKPRVRAGACC